MRRIRCKASHLSVGGGARATRKKPRAPGSWHIFVAVSRRFLPFSYLPHTNSLATMDREARLVYQEIKKFGNKGAYPPHLRLGFAAHS